MLLQKVSCRLTELITPSSGPLLNLTYAFIISFILHHIFFLSICLPNQTVSFAKLGRCFITSLSLTPSNIPCPGKDTIHFCSNGKLSKLTKLSKCKITYIHRLSLADIMNKAICYILDLRTRFLMWLLLCLRKWGHRLVEQYRRQLCKSSVTFRYLSLRHVLDTATLRLHCLLPAKVAVCHMATNLFVICWNISVWEVWLS